MKRFLMLAALTLVTSVPAFPQGAGEQEVRDVVQRTRDASIKGDVAFFERAIAEDYVGINALGEVTTKAQMLDNYRSGALKYEVIDADQMQVRVYGDTAVVSAHARVKMAFKGQDRSGEYQTTRVLVKRNGTWQTVSFQATRVAPATP